MLAVTVLGVLPEVLKASPGAALYALFLTEPLLKGG